MLQARMDAVRGLDRGAPFAEVRHLSADLVRVGAFDKDRSDDLRRGGGAIVGPAQGPPPASKMTARRLQRSDRADGPRQHAAQRRAVTLGVLLAMREVLLAGGDIGMGKAAREQCRPLPLELGASACAL
jgi:hypothetical protein